VTARPGTYRIPRPAPPPDDSQDASVPDSPPRAQLCTHCGAVGTHYLTCPSLRLPAGYRLTSGPHHPDWPLPPRP